MTSVPLVDHWSLTPDPNRGGTYYRRIEDIKRALEKLGIPTPNNKAINFLAYFFGCEKLAFGILGIKNRLPATEAYKPSVKLELEEIKSAATDLYLPTDNLPYLFAVHKEQESLPNRVSARGLRHKVAHDFGPTNVANMANQADFFVPKMQAFLACDRQVLTYLEKKYGHLLSGSRTGRT